MRNFLCLLVLGATAAAADTPGFQLGINYSEWLSAAAANNIQLSTDNAGDIYFLTNIVPPSGFAISTVTKLTPDGKTLLWQNPLDFAATVMTVDPTGGVYVVPLRQQSDTTAYIAKLSPSGTGLAWKASIGFPPWQLAPAIAADSEGRVFFSAATAGSNWVGRLNSSGSAVDFAIRTDGVPTSIAVDPSGAAYIAGYVSTPGVDAGFLTKIAADGTAGYYTVFPSSSALSSQAVAVDGAGNATLFGGSVVQRVDASGVLATKTAVAGGTAFALDAAGNAYVAGGFEQLSSVKNSLAPCHFDPAMPRSFSELLSVVAPDGSIVQATYIPGVNKDSEPQLAVTPSGTVLITGSAGSDFTPTQTGPFPAGPAGGVFLSNLSFWSSQLFVTLSRPNMTALNSSAPTYPLACAGNSASLAIGAISPGELVTLFGNGLGPQQGEGAQLNGLNAYPTQVSNVQVTFDGIPAPLLWVQDSQINLVAPWSLNTVGAMGGNTQVCVSYNKVKTNCLTVPVVQFTPAVFIADSEHAAALNQDGTYNSATNPATPGSIVTIYATGLGPITPASPDGMVSGLPLAANAFAFGVEAAVGIHGSSEYVPFDIQYAGPAPMLVAGVTQINFRIVPYASYGLIYLDMGSTTFGSGFSIYLAGQ